MPICSLASATRRSAAAMSGPALQKLRRHADRDVGRPEVERPRAAG